MVSRRKMLTEEMKAGIRAAAAALFAEKGYSSVTMREIAGKAGCSHTAIYLYFRNKEDLLQQIAIPPLEELNRRIVEELERPLPAIDRLRRVCREYVVFCLSNGSFYNVLISSGGGRVDVEEPELEVNRIRNGLFGHIMRALDAAVSDDSANPGTNNAEKSLNRSRILFYYLQGFVQTYAGSEEPLDSILERTLPIFEDGIDIFVAGIRLEPA